MFIPNPCTCSYGISVAVAFLIMLPIRWRYVPARTPTVSWSLPTVWPSRCRNGSRTITTSATRSAKWVGLTTSTHNSRLARWLLLVNGDYKWSCVRCVAHAAVPDFAAGAMENWGLVLYRETALLYDEMTSSAANKQRVAVVVSHELSHLVKQHSMNCLDT